MPVPPASQPITLHPALGRLDPNLVAAGPAIPPTVRVGSFSPSDWEEFVNEWASTLAAYQKVERASGAGDLGCDVIGIPTVGVDVWDNYQCKHYAHALMPSDIWVELGKICHYTFSGAYSLPRAYRFVAPRDVGTSLAALLRKPNDLRTGLINAWDTHCRAKISGIIPLSPELRAHIEGLDFGIFGYMPVLEVIEQHKMSSHYVARFGLGLPRRPDPMLPPPTLGSHETMYVRQLLEAYSDNAGNVLADHATLSPPYQGHFNRSREYFYSAESLRNFSRDTLPEGTFEHLKNQIFDGVVDTCESTHACGFTRVKATTSQATQVSVTSSPLIGKTDVADIHGICHQLANEERLIWVPKEVRHDGSEPV